MKPYHRFKPLSPLITTNFAKYYGKPIPLSCFSSYRHYVSRTNTKKGSENSLVYIPGEDTPSLPPSINTNNNTNNNKNIYNNKTEDNEGNKMLTYDEYFKTLPKQTLFSLLLIGLCSLNKLTLSTAVKLFPYVPLSWVRILVSKLYCGGENMNQVLKCGQDLQGRGISNMMLSLTIENAEGDKQITNIDEIVNMTIDSIHNCLKPNLLSQLDTVKCQNGDINSIAPGYIALKPSALVQDPHQVLMNFNTHPDSNILVNNCTKVVEEIHQLNKELSVKYPTRTVPFFIATIDAEKFDLQQNGVYQLQRELMAKYNRQNLISVIGTWQLYLCDSMRHLQRDVEHATRNGYKLGLKIVRGAYIHSEPQRSKIIFTTKHGTDLNFDQIMSQIINDMSLNGSKSIYSHLVVASHNVESQIQAANMLNNLPNTHYAKGNVTLGQLLGMADNIAYDLIHQYGMTNLIKYVPWGPVKETRDYLLRRLQENGDAVRSDNGWGLVKRVLKALW